MFVAGCDIGSLTAKAVILEEGQLLSHGRIRAKPNPAVSAQEVMGIALEAAGLTLSNLSFVVGTGYGKAKIPFVNSLASEIACHARGVHHLVPDARFVIDIGGQDAKATRMGKDGSVERYTYNDKCASGTGRFLEIMAEAMEVPLEAMGAIGEGSTEKLTISNQCVIFAETEVVSLINEGKQIPDVVEALHQALAKRVAAMARSIGVVEKVVMTGGVAKNSGVFNAMARTLGIRIEKPGTVDPQLMGALGAALIAGEKATGKSGTDEQP